MRIEINQFFDGCHDGVMRKSILHYIDWKPINGVLLVVAIGPWRLIVFS